MQEVIQAEKLHNKLKELGIPYKVNALPPTIAVFDFIKDDDMLCIGIDSHPREGIKDAAVIIWKDDIQQPLEQADSQYLIDNIETIYNTFII